MNTGEAISILRRLGVEQTSMKELWGQMTPALKHLEAVLSDIETKVNAYVNIEAQLVEKQKALDGLDGEYTRRANDLRQQEAKIREELNVETTQARKELSAVVAKLAEVRKDLANKEQVGKDRLAQLDIAIKKQEAALKQLADDYAAFRKKVGA